jgi:putative flippase GtrA
MREIPLIQWVKKYEQVFRFLLAGGIAFAVNIVVLYLFTDILGIYYLISTVWAFLISFGVSFLLQKFWTFQDGSRDRFHIQLPLYLGMQVANLGLNTVLMYAFVEYLHIWYLFSQVIIAAGIAVSSFYINKTYIFKLSAPGSLLNEDFVR